ncbi:MAG: tetratricopeptide repeat protein, partial [Acetobacteraceae bacterium]
GLGLALFEEGLAEEAAKEYRTAIALDPKSALAHNNLGYFFLDRGNPDAAAPEFREAIRLDPRIASAHYGLALALLGTLSPAMPASARLSLLNAACRELNSDVTLAPGDRKAEAEIHSMDRLLPSGQRCLPP